MLLVALNIANSAVMTSLLDASYPGLRQYGNTIAVPHVADHCIAYLAFKFWQNTPGSLGDVDFCAKYSE